MSENPEKGEATYAGAIVVDDDALTRVADGFRQLFAGMHIQATAYTARGDDYVFHGNSLDLVRTVQNPRANQVTSVVFRAKSEGAKVNWVFSKSGPPLGVSWSGIEKETATKLRKLFLDEAHNTRSFYAGIYGFLSWVSSGWRLRLLASVWFIATLAFLILAVYGAFSGERNRSSSPPLSAPIDVRPVPKELPASSDSNVTYRVSRPKPRAILRELWKQSWPAVYWLLLVAIVMLGFLLMVRCFPRIVFATREGKERYTRMLWFRGVFLTSGIIPIVRQWLLSR